MIAEILAEIIWWSVTAFLGIVTITCFASSIEVAINDDVGEGIVGMIISIFLLIIFLFCLFVGLGI